MRLRNISVSRRVAYWDAGLTVKSENDPAWAHLTEGEVG